MGEKSKIGWTDHTFNPWWGCSKVSPGCDHCYAEAFAKRVGKRLWGPGVPRALASAKVWSLPGKWQAAAGDFAECTGCGRRGRRGYWISDLRRDYPEALPFTCCPDQELVPARQRVFVASMADVWDNEVPAEWRERLWEVVRATPGLDWLVLSKRIGNAARMLPSDWGAGYPNVWLGATLVNQQEADRDLPKLLRLDAAVRFVSLEPMLGDINLPLAGYTGAGSFAAIEGLGWVIVGGESGAHWRERLLDLPAVNRVVAECVVADIPVYVKQDSGPVPGTQGRLPDHVWELKQFPRAKGGAA